MKGPILLLLVSLVAMLNSYAQWGQIHTGTIILKSGDLKKIRAEKNIKVKYDYSKMEVGDVNGSKNTEDEYVNKKVNEYNSKKEGKGDKWKARWIDNRMEKFQPKFEELFNETSDGITLSERPDSSRYTLIVKTVFLEPGYSAISGFASDYEIPASVNFEFAFVETANSENIVAELYVNRVSGNQVAGAAFDIGPFIAKSYAEAGKMLGKFIKH